MTKKQVEEKDKSSRHIQEIVEDDESVTIKFGKSQVAETIAEQSYDDDEDKKDISVKEEEKIIERNIDLSGLSETNLEKQFRLATSRKINDENRTVDLAFSSEEPVERSFGFEVLDHARSSVDTDFMDSGRSPLLLDHDMTKQIGVIERVSIDTDRVGRAVVRFGKSELANEIYQDVKDGIRSNISVGYQINKMERQSKSKEKRDTFIVRDWSPLEISVVSIPADQSASVGIGRANDETNKVIITQQQERTKTMENENIEIKDTPKVDVASVQAQARSEETKRIRDIQDLGARHQQKELSDKAVNDGVSLAEFRGQVLNAIGNSKPLDKPTDEVGLTKKEERQYSFARGIKAMATGDWSEAGFEKELSDQISKQSGKQARGLFIPSDISWNKRDLTQGSATAGGNLVATDLLAGNFIEALRSRSFVRQAGATVLSGLIGDVAIPAMNAATTAYWVAENGAPTEGAPTYRQVSLAPKTVSAYVDISRHLMHQATPNIDAIVRKDVVTSLASAVDKAALVGTGSSNQPTGITATTGIGSHAIATNGGAPTWASVVETWETVATDSADLGALNWFTTPKIVAKMMQTAKVASTDSVMIMNVQNDLMGYNLYSTTQLPDNLTKGNQSASSPLIFGNFNDLVIGEFGNLDVMVDPYSLSTTGATRIASFYDVDIAVRHAQSFGACLDLIG